MDYGNASGQLGADLRVTFGGLRRFVVPFSEDSDDTDSIFAPFLDLYIPHGLADGTDIADIPITLVDNSNQRVSQFPSTTDESKECAQVFFNLTQEKKTVLRLRTAIGPSKRYT